MNILITRERSYLDDNKRYVYSRHVAPVADVAAFPTSRGATPATTADWLVSVSSICVGVTGKVGTLENSEVGISLFGASLVDIPISSHRAALERLPRTYIRLNGL